MPDFSLLSQPNFAQAALGGFKAGQAQAQQNRLDSALSGIDLERPETLLPVLRADPSTGAALIGASTKLAAESRDQRSRAALGAWVKMVSGGGGGALTGQSPPAPSPAPIAAPAGTDQGPPTVPPSAPGAQPSAGEPGDIVVTGQRVPDPANDPNAVRNAAIDADPATFLDFQSKIATMNKAQRDALDDASQTFASVGQTALSLPYEQRRAFIQAHASTLVAHGVPMAQIQSFDPTDQNIHTEVGTALGVKGQLDKADKDRAFDNTVRHQGVEEAQGAARIGIERGNQGIAAGHLAIAQRADARAATAASARAAGAAAGAPTRSQYVKVGGVWKQVPAQ